MDFTRSVENVELNRRRARTLHVGLALFNAETDAKEI